MENPIVTVRKFEEMKSVLMSPAVEKPDLLPYYVIKNPGQNFTVLSPIMYGKEFNKTYGHYHVPPYPEKYKLLYGSGLILIQELVNDSGPFNEISKIYVKKLDIGKWFDIPPNSAHILVNTGNDIMITQDDQSDSNFSHDYKSIANLRGMGYYIVKSESGGIDFVKNRNYSKLPRIKVL